MTAAVKTCQRGHERPAAQKSCPVCKAATEARRYKEGVVTSTAPVTERIDPTYLNPDLRHEWEHFAGYGWSDQRIAAAVGYTLDTVRQHVRRAKQAERNAETIAEAVSA
ncbi:hypothetical protein [Gordonia alkaliphila]|uniref:Uncharacterized protein n=1 Tax=Gordonia alkaliphila TaxID=1053547 RepID=A0ABP8ZGQ8_9ACTN